MKISNYFVDIRGNFKYMDINYIDELQRDGKNTKVIYIMLGLSRDTYRKNIKNLGYK